MKNKNQGITLVALVITIIILLILAGISIAALTGSGLFEKAKLAKQKQEDAQALENETLVGYENYIDGYVGNNRDTIEISSDDYNKLLNRITELENNQEFHAGDSYHVTNMTCSGFVTGAAKEILFSIMLPKNISSDVTSITFSTTGFNIRRPSGGYLINSTYANATSNVNLADYFFYILNRSENVLMFHYQQDTAISNATNNTPVSVQLYNMNINFN